MLRAQYAAPAMDESGDGQRSAYEEGNRLAQAGDLDAAYDAYQRADDEGHGTAAAYAGTLAQTRGDLSAAEAAYRRADERGDGFGAYRLGLLLSQGGDWEGAEEAWRRAEERGYESPPFDSAALLRGEPAAAPRASSPGTLTPRSAFANPVLVGALTLLILMVAVFLAYNANSGLPFVPTRELKVDIADGSNLVIGNDVREGGTRIGLVSDMRPVRLAGGSVGAQLTLQLSKNNGDVPRDSTVSVQPLSVLGLKYVDLQKGASRKVLADGGTLPLGQSSVPVQFDDVFKTFDPKTRVAIQQDLQGYGDVLAGRGSDLNDTIASLPALLQHLEPVARYLSAPGTELTRLFAGLNSFMGAVAPVAAVNADLFGRMATTFQAISASPQDLERTIAESPSTLSVSTRSLRVQQPFLADLTTLGRFMTPATASLRQALPVLNPALETGSRVLVRTPALDAKLQQVMGALKHLAQAPGTNVGVNALVSTVNTLNPMVRYLGPFQTVCDYWNYWWTFLAEHISEQTQYGFAQRVLLNFADASQPDNVGSLGATAPAGSAGGPEFLHSQVYGAAIDNAGNADCETGQRGYPKKLNYFDPQGRNLDSDPHTPGDQGPTYKGRTRVPAGETYSRNPQTGPQLPYNPTNP
jgi:virulence factor Mce-like protein